MTTYAPERPTTGSTKAREVGVASFLISTKLALSLSESTGTVAWLPAVSDELNAADAVTGIGGFTSSRPAAGTTSSATATSLRQLRARTRLSWDDLARLFGVSRRSVHKWANGGAMNSRHAQRLARLAAVISTFEGPPEEVRAQLLAPDRSGTTVFQKLVSEARPERTSPDGFTVDQLMGVRRDGDVTSHGKPIGVTDVIPWPKRST